MKTRDGEPVRRAVKPRGKMTDNLLVMQTGAGDGVQGGTTRARTQLRIIEVRVIVTCPDRNYVLVKVLTNEPGLYGVGDATLNGRELAVSTVLEKHIAPVLIGRDPERVEETWQYLYRAPYWRSGPVQMTALAGIDLALWDIKGKLAGMPVYQLLGGRTRRGALAYTHATGKSFDETEEAVRRAMERGFKAVRAQVAIPGLEGTYGTSLNKTSEETAGRVDQQADLPSMEVFEPGPYLRTIPKLFEHLRLKLGDEVELLHDVHQKLGPVEAARLAHELEPFHLFFLEDPVPPEAKDGLRLVRQRSATPIAIGEIIHSPLDFVPLITERLIDYVRCAVTHIGGLTAARKLASLAEFYQVKTAWHGPADVGPPAHAASVHLDLAIQNFGIQEMVFFSDAAREVMPGGPVFQGGYMNVDDSPGLGTDINEELAKKYPYRRSYLPLARRKDGSVHDW